MYGLYGLKQSILIGGPEPSISVKALYTSRRLYGFN